MKYRSKKTKDIEEKVRSFITPIVMRHENLNQRWQRRWIEFMNQFEKNCLWKLFKNLNCVNVDNEQKDESNVSNKASS